MALKETIIHIYHPSSRDPSSKKKLRPGSWKLAAAVVAAAAAAAAAAAVAFSWRGVGFHMFFLYNLFTFDKSI